MSDESHADDGAIHAFWAFILRRRRQGHHYDLENVARLREAINDFEAGL